MSNERWDLLARLFAEAREHPLHLREAFLAQVCGSDLGMRSELETLLAADSEATGFLDRPALEAFASRVARDGWSVRAGDRLGCYEVEQRLGAGGMGEVFRARDTRLGRLVALKLLLPQGSDQAERTRLLYREARLTSTLNHPNVVTVYDVGEHRSVPYLVSEHLEGESLRARLTRCRPSTHEALAIAVQIARGLGAIHALGIVHADLKPENVFLTLDGRVKILDFGLAWRDHTPNQPRQAGTLGYMAPEQVDGTTLDWRADIFALGVVLQEMLTGRRRDARIATRADIAALLTRCMAKAPRDRFASTEALTAALEAASKRKTPRRATIGVALATAITLLGYYSWNRSETSSTAPEVQRLLNQGDFTQAYSLARHAIERAPNDALLGRLWRDASVPAVIASDPPGARVVLYPYAAPSAEGIVLGETPLSDARIPRGLFRLTLSKPGFHSVEGTGSPSGVPRFRLDSQASLPRGMVRVRGGRAPGRFGVVAELDDFFIDRYEVTNAEFQEFVDQGGYARPELWREPFLDAERALSFEEAMRVFRDASGRPGPATFRDGHFPAGQANLPVTGVSVYEASAYALFRGKSLPTLFHWYHAATLGRFPDILSASNFGDSGPLAVGTKLGLGPYGTYDMAGNVREWSANASERGHFVLGGAWNDAERMFANCDVKASFERSASTGIRLVKYLTPPAPAVTAAIRFDGKGRDVRSRVPVNDALFEMYRRQFAYDKTPLNAELEAVIKTDAFEKQRVLLDAADSVERMRVHLFLPKNAAPPFQTVVFLPPTDVAVTRSASELPLAWGEPIVQSGRAFIYPVYKGMCERRTDLGKLGENGARERMVAWSRDLGRTIDYLETRSDLSLGELTFYAVGAGPAAVLLAALEQRLKFSVLQGSGIGVWGEYAPELDAVNYAPRVHIPTLLLNARYDLQNPVEASQRPLFEMLGTSSEHKQHIVLEMSHGIPVAASAREIIPWLERHLGPVTTTGPR